MIPVLVVVGSVQSMAVAVMEVIDMVAMFNGFVTAILAVGMLLKAVLSDGTVFIVVVTVEGVVVFAVNVVDVVTVLDCFVSAVFAVLVLSNGVLGVLICHGALLRQMMANEESIARSL